MRLVRQTLEGFGLIRAVALGLEGLGEDRRGQSHHRCDGFRYAKCLAPTDRRLTIRALPVVDRYSNDIAKKMDAFPKSGLTLDLCGA